MRGSKKDLPVAFENGEAVSRQAEWGGMNIALESGPVGFDPSPLLKGLPDDRCQCPHWGYVIQGKMKVTYADHEEILSTGDVYYMRPGHIALILEGGEVVEFSPSEEYHKMAEVAMANMAKLQASQV